MISWLAGRRECLLLTEVAFFAAPWPTTLYLDGGGQWDFRVPIFFENKGAQDIVGEECDFGQQKTEENDVLFHNG